MQYAIRATASRNCELAVFYLGHKSPRAYCTNWLFFGLKITIALLQAMAGKTPDYNFQRS